MNGKERIKPLSQMYDVATGHSDWGIEDSGGQFYSRIAVNIDWRPVNWNRTKLSKMVSLRYSDYRDVFSSFKIEYDCAGRTRMAYDFIEEGDLPETAVAKAEKIICSVDPIDYITGIEDHQDNDDEF